MKPRRPIRAPREAGHDPAHPYSGRYVTIIGLDDGARPPEITLRPTNLGIARCKRQLRSRGGAYGTYSNYYEACERLLFDLEKRGVAMLCHCVPGNLTSAPQLLLDGDWSYLSSEGRWSHSEWRTVEYKGRYIYWQPNYCIEDTPIELFAYGRDLILQLHDLAR